MAISEYFNSNNDVTKIAMADIFEERFLLDKANTYYDSIKKDSEMYYPAQMKKANNLTSNEKYDEAIVVLKKLLKSNPKNFQILFNLGDALRISDKQEEAIKYYNQAIDAIFYESEKSIRQFGQAQKIGDICLLSFKEIQKSVRRRL